MYCKNCGKELEKGTEVCKACGVTVGNGLKCCADCGTKLEAGKCPRCSAPAVKKESGKTPEEKKTAPEKKAAPAKKPAEDVKKTTEQPTAVMHTAKEEPKGIGRLLSFFRKK